MHRWKVSSLKFHSLKIVNLRAIRRFEIDDLGSFVVVAGQNGSGKSCVFDAIRLLKSFYGGYLANEYHHWFGEFQINLQDRNSLKKLFRDVNAPIQIDATVSFSPEERDYIQDNVESVVQPIAWQEVTGQPVDYWSFSRIAVAPQLLHVQPQLTEVTRRLVAEVRSAVANELHTLSLEIAPNGEIRIVPSTLVQVAFQAYAPDNLGVIEYHSASRSYSRQPVGGIDLDVRNFEDQQRQQRLYNWQAKYQNVKTELAASYLRHIIARESGQGGSGNDLNETLKELFSTFFPDKTYEGVRPQAHGSLEFPVRLSTGEVHDIDELSSGEKEILYGYLKLSNSTPNRSVILLDEPELHLNPSLLQGFADFYYRHLGVAQGNQLWLVTHSDTLLRQAVGNANYRVYQMVPATTSDSTDNQAVEILTDDHVERVTIELVGDLASYRPHGKVVILEGRSENGFDVNMVRRLFPEFAQRVNLVSGGNKPRVRDLYAALQEAASQAGIRNRFFAIVDKDSETALEADAGASEFSWDSYHIENYLLDSGSIRAAVESLLPGANPFASDDGVLYALQDCACELVDSLILVRLQNEVNSMFVTAINIKGPPNTASPAKDLLPSINSSVDRILDVGDELTADTLSQKAEVHRAILQRALESAEWSKEFPGRLVLRRFADKYLSGKINALLFSNLVLDKMVERSVKPEPMRIILDQIAER